MSSWNPRANEIFLQALELPPEQRAAHLDAACGGDAELRQAVEGLLQAHGQAGSFLEKPAEAAATAEYTPLGQAGEPTIRERPEGPGTRVGPYKLLQLLGEGGMGTVYMAVQEHPVRRRVALKIIKPGMDSRHVLARFEQERQALAVMDHPNIAKVLDAGTVPFSIDDCRFSIEEEGRQGPQSKIDNQESAIPGRPYFVMELVKGIPITKYCDQEHLTPQERLQLFIPVCQAVQHAHQKGIIHRDLKPSNVLVALYDGRPVPKVIDFGVAKATGQRLTEQTMFTEMGQMVGTMEYMAPEQAELNNLDIDTRADIYSLGVLLYELLTGHLPFSSKQLRGAAFAEMLRMIREVEPSKPSTKLSGSEELPAIAARRKLEPKRLTKLVHGELDWIVMKCLEKERGRRYGTSSALADDIQHYLDHEPVLAGPPSAAYRLRKFLRRNKGPVLAASLVILALVAGTIVSTWQAIEATSARQLADERLENERQARRDADAHSRRADTNAAKAHEAVERLLKRVAQKRLANEPRMEHLRRELMEDALEFYLGFLEKKRDDPSARHDVADAYGRVAVISAGLGRHEQAADALDKALAVLKPVLDLEPKNPRYRLCLAKLLGNRGALYDGQGRHDEAERYLRQALDVAERLAAEHPQEPDYTVQRARTLGNLGVSCSRPGRVKEAEGFHRAALQLREELAKRFPQNAQYRQDVAMNQTNLGHTLEGLGRDLEALSAYETAIGIQTRLVEERPNDPEIREELAGSYNNRGNVLKRAGRLQEAEDSFRQSAALWGRLIAEYPVPSYARFCVAAHHSVGTTLAQMGQFRKAEEAYRRALAVQERLAAAFPNEVELHRELAGHRADLAWFLCTWPDPEVRKPADALRLAQQAVNHAPDDRRYWRSLGIAQYRAAQWQDAIQSLIKCIELRQNSYTSTECFFLAMAHHQLGDQDEARQWFERGVIWLAKYKAAAPMTQQLLRIEAAELLGIQETDRLDNNPENSPKK